MKNKIPPPIITLIFLLGSFAISKVFPSAGFASVLSSQLPIAVLIIAAIIMVWAVIAFRRAKTTVNPLQPEKASSLVTSGIFSISRNPMYLGMLLILIAGILHFANAITIALVPVFILYMNVFQIQPEETALQNLFGEEFKTYCRKTRRWI